MADGDRRHPDQPAARRYRPETGVGDPTETQAIGATYGNARRAAGQGPVVVGTIKSNIGHTEAVAGVAGIIKATLTLLNRETTPLANFQTLNPAIHLDQWNHLALLVVAVQEREAAMNQHAIICK